MAELDDLLDKRAELSAANLRRTTMIGFGLDLVVAGALVIFKDTLGVGDIAYFVAAILVFWGFTMLLIFPRLPGWGLRQYRKRLESAEGKGEEEK